MSDPPTNAAELLDALLTRGIADEARNIPGADRTVRLRIHGIQVAHIRFERTRGSAQKKLERFWTDRVGNTALRLVVVADDPSPESAAKGALLVFGPLRGTPLRSLPAGILLRVLRDADGQDSGLGATRHLASALARYDRSELPGLLVRGLLTTHTLSERFRGSPKWKDARAAVSGLPPRGHWDETLQALGYSLERLPDQGWLARAGNARAAVILPRAPGEDLAQLDEDGRPPEGRLVEICNKEDVRYGLLASGSRLRLFDARSPAATSQWIELDTEALVPEERPFLALLGPGYLAGDGLAEVQEEARDYGVRLWKRLDQRIRDEALPALAEGLDRWAAQEGFDTTDEAERQDLEHASLTLLFRLMFLLYTESAGFLPMGNPVYRGVSLTALVAEARDTQEHLGQRSTALWSRFLTLLGAMREGNPAWGVPAYNGALFHPSALEGAALLERIQLADPEFARVLIALGIDKVEGRGVDYSSLEIGHLGHIYESLLSLNLSVTVQPVRYDPHKDEYRHVHQTGGIPAGSLLWQTNEGGRKVGGVYYTPTALVRHLVDRTVRPAYREHLAEVGRTAATDPQKAVEDLLDFAVVDPACGSGHFLVQVVDALADEAARFLARCPLPALVTAMEGLREGGAGSHVEDMALLRRLLVKHSVFGVDVSPMGAEIATLSLWLAAFVPGLSLSYLGRNIRRGNSLIGVANRHSVVQPNTFDAKRLEKRLQLAAEAVARVAASQDRTPNEYERSRAEDRAASEATAGLTNVFDLWTAEPFGQPGNRSRVAGEGFRIVTGDEDLPQSLRVRVRRASELAAQHSFLHWSLAFPQVFARGRPGFDAVVGNPPWEEITVEELGFYTLFLPGVNSLPGEERDQAVADLCGRRPELPARLAAEQERVRAERTALAAGEYESTSGDPDLYKYFGQRYRALLRPGGYLGVVLPRSAFNAKGSLRFRDWLHQKTTVRRVDFLLNKGRWAFDTEPRYSIGLVAARNTLPPKDHRIEVVGTADSVAAWKAQTAGAGVRVTESALGPDRQLPLLRSQREADVLGKVRRGSVFPRGPAGRWKCFAVAELHETNDKKFWQSGTGSRQLWKGGSFDQYDPHGSDSRPCAVSGALWKKIRKPRPGSGQLLRTVALQTRRDAVVRESERARVVFRDLSRGTDSRTVRACMVPPRVLLNNTAPYLAFVQGNEPIQAAAVGILNSLPFDFQARRYVEIHLNFFILEGLIVPDLSDEDCAAISDAAARLSAVDDRFADFAAATGVSCGELPDAERERLRIEIDARVARAWDLTADDLSVLFEDFTTRAVPVAYRTALLQRFEELR